MSTIVHPKTEKMLAEFKKELPQSIVLSGERGVGLGTIAREIAGTNLSAFLEPENSKGEVNHETGTLSVDAIRLLYESTRTKQTKRRVIVIDDADRMSSGAQAAFLKLLEEPNASTYFILTTHSPQLLLPTIRSRVQEFIVVPVTPEQTDSLLKELGIKDAKKRTQLEYLASGLPAELCRLAHDEAYFTKRAEIMGDARDLLTSSPYKRILVVQKYHSDRAAALQLLESAISMTRRSVTKDAEPKLVKKLDQLLTVSDRISANHNIRLQLLDFVL